MAYARSGNRKSATEAYKLLKQLDAEMGRGYLPNSRNSCSRSDPGRRVYQRILKTRSTIIPRALFTAAVLGAGVICMEPAAPCQHKARSEMRRSACGCPCGIASKRPDPFGMEGLRLRMPPIAHELGVSGAVVVEVTIGEAGEVISASAMSGPPLLRGVAEAAARERSFKAGQISGVAVRTISAITFNFQAPDSSEDVSATSQRAQQVERERVLVQRQVALHLLTVGSWTKAIDALKEAIRMDPHDARAKSALGLAYTATGRDSEAAWMYRLATLDNPSSAAAYLALGMSLSNLKKYEGARAALTRAIELRPAQIDAYLELGVLYEASGRTADAISTLRDAVLVSPELARAHFALGTACLKVGDRDAARAEYEKLKTLNAGMAVDLMGEIERKYRPIRRHPVKSTRKE